jgi:hypothetical protein
MDIAGTLMELVIAELIRNVLKKKEGCADADSKSRDIDRAESLVVVQMTQGDGKVVLDHGLVFGEGLSTTMPWLVLRAKIQMLSCG